MNSGESSASWPAQEFSSNALDQKIDAYRAQVEAWLRKFKTYPSMARRLRQQGRVLVAFTLDRNGQLIEKELVEGSSFDSLNRSALDLIEGLDGEFPFDSETKEVSRKFIVPIEYKL